MGKDISCKSKRQESRSCNTQSDKIDFKMKDIKKDKEGHYLMTKESFQEEDIKIVNMYAPHIGVPRYMQQILKDIKKEKLVGMH